MVVFLVRVTQAVNAILVRSAGGDEATSLSSCPSSSTCLRQPPVQPQSDESTPDVNVVSTRDAEVRIDQVNVDVSSSDDETMSEDQDGSSERLICVLGSAGWAESRAAHSAEESDLGEVDSSVEEGGVSDDDDVFDPVSSGSEDTSSEEDDGVRNPKIDKDSKYLVFDQQLGELFCRCQKCGAINLPDCTTKYTVGSMLVVKTTCASGHEVTWKSQPTYGKAPAGNILLASAILFVDGLFGKFQAFAEALKLSFISRTFFFTTQRDFLCPVINYAWQLHRDSMHKVLQGSPLELLGDGRCDSPGYSAKYCTYKFFLHL